MREGDLITEWRYGWPIVAAGLLGLAVMALHVGPLGVLMKPLGDLFAWSRSEISAGLMVITIVQFLLVPVVGLLIPRLGVRKIAVVGTVVYAAGLGALGFCTPNISSWYLGWVVLGIGLAGICPLVWTSVITRVFVSQRGLALSVALSGGGIAAFATPLVSAYAFASLGWRAPFFVLAGFALLFALPALGWLMSIRPEFGPYATAQQAQQHPGDRRYGALTDSRVWRLVLASLMIAGSVGMITAHMQAIMRDAGASATQAAACFAVTGPSMIAGRLLAGLMLDRMSPRGTAALLFMVPALTCELLLHYDGSAFWGFFTCVIFGTGYGAETDVLSYLTAYYFGTRRYPLIYSFVYGVFGLGYGAAAVLGGAVYDRFGSYDKILYSLLIGVLLGILLIVTLGSGERNPRRGGKYVVSW